MGTTDKLLAARLSSWESFQSCLVSLFTWLEITTIWLCKNLQKISQIYAILTVRYSCHGDMGHRDMGGDVKKQGAGWQEVIHERQVCEFLMMCNSSLINAFLVGLPEGKVSFSRKKPAKHMDLFEELFNSQLGNHELRNTKHKGRAQASFAVIFWDNPETGGKWEQCRKKRWKCRICVGSMQHVHCIFAPTVLNDVFTLLRLNWRCFHGSLVKRLLIRQAIKKISWGQGSIWTPRAFCWDTWCWFRSFWLRLLLRQNRQKKCLREDSWKFVKDSVIRISSGVKVRKTVSGQCGLTWPYPQMKMRLLVDVVYGMCLHFL